MRRWLAAGLCLWLLAAIAPLHAQVPATPQPRQLTVADGLPSSSINGFAEDHFGYLWLASRDGLARYDGRGYRFWRAEDGLRDNLVWSVHVDARNQLWIGTQSVGLVMLSADRRHFRFYNRRTHPQIGSNTVWSIASTPDGSVWFGTATGGLHRLGPDGQVRRFMPQEGNPRSLPSPAVGYLAVTPDGSLWVGTKNGLARWTGGGFERVDDDLLPSPKVNGLTVDEDGNLWVASVAGVVVRGSDGRFRDPPWRGQAPGHVLGMMLRDRDGGYWLDTLSGLGRGSGEVVHNVPLYSAVARGMVKPNWSTAYEDREGGLWFASTNAGLWHLAANWRQFSVLSRRVDDPGSLRNGYALGLAAAADGGIWVVGTRGALDKLDPATGEVEHHLAVIDGANWAQSVAEDQNGRVWIGSVDALVRYDPRDGGVVRWYHGQPRDAAMPGESEIIRVCEGGLVWIFSEDSGLQQRDLDGRVLRQVAPGTAGLAANQTIEDMHCGPEEALWLATSQGLMGWSEADAAFLPVPGGPASHLYTFNVTDAGVAWLVGMGTMEQYLWDGHRLSLLDRIGIERDLPALAPGALLVDGAGVAWASSARGLIRIDPASKAVRRYGVHDGLPSQEFRRRALVRSGNGQIAGGTPEGLVLFDPDRVRPATRQPPLVIERVDVRRGDEVLDLTHVMPMEIADGDRDLHIVARLLSFADSAANSYRFRLGGYDPDWVDVGASGERVFSRLPPGRYLLEVQARTADNVWSQVQPLRFRVLPPWWRSTGGIALFVAAGLLLAWWLAHLYRRRLRRRHAWQLALHKQELAEQASLAKTRFLATLGHEVRTPMTGVLGMSELLLASELDPKQRGYTESIRRAGEHLLRLVNDALDLARIEAGRLELVQQPFDLQQLIGEVHGLMAPLAQQRGLRFVLDNRLPPRISASGDPMRVRQILLNLLGNAIKFTARGSVSLCAEALPGNVGLRFEIADTGPGINAEQQQRLFQRFEQADGARTAARYGGSGLGLAICQELAVAMGGRIGIDSTLGSGSRFSVELPLPWVESVVEADAAVADAARRLSPLPPLRILLVEDDATIADVISGLLSVRGHQVVHAAHGLAALAEAAGSTFDVGLLDLDLPGLDGLALARQLHVLGYDMPLIAVTARSDANAEPQAYEAGFDGFLRKPVTGELLVEAIARILQPHLHPDAGATEKDVDP
ncbi:hybrid sensor histidine kinase/response regulator [Xanthomonas chitinilytica]|uniref:hybrid sensor histidine kinase/response regulator n=1 Tax=Xanthomonas chitinilytica TaxID=2989819 RepID=UPI003CCDF835